MDRPIRAMMIGAHPDDCDFSSGGLALKYAEAGHKVKFLSLCDGSGGHQTMEPDEIALRRRGETQRVAELAGIEYEVWDVRDCELFADIPTRKRLVRTIRAFNPDIIFCSRPNDYHADHRNSSILVQDASYLLIVPHFCPDAPAMKQMPVIMHFYDRFQTPPFEPFAVIRTDDVIDRKFELLACHESQVFEWLPYTEGRLDSVPSDPKARLEWLHEPRIPKDGSPLDELILPKNLTDSECECLEAVPAVKYRKNLIERYGEEEGRRVRFAEAFAVSEYGSPLTPEAEKRLLPF